MIENKSEKEGERERGTHFDGVRACPPETAFETAYLDAPTPSKPPAARQSE